MAASGFSLSLVFWEFQRRIDKILHVTVVSCEDCVLQLTLLGLQCGTTRSPARKCVVLPVYMRITLIISHHCITFMSWEGLATRGALLSSSTSKRCPSLERRVKPFSMRSCLLRGRNSTTPSTFQESSFTKQNKSVVFSIAASSSGWPEPLPSNTFIRSLSVPPHRVVVAFLFRSMVSSSFFLICVSIIYRFLSRLARFEGGCGFRVIS